MAWGGPDTARVIAPPPLIYLAFLLLGLGLDRVWPLGEPLLGTHARLIVAAAVLLVGAWLGTISAAAFAKAGTNVIPNKPALALVTTGPFAWSRNPGYIAQTLIYLGLAIAAGSLWALAFLIPVLVIIHVGVIRREETYLETRFGDAYREYKARVRRWL